MHVREARNGDYDAVMDLMRQLNPDDPPFSEAERRTFSQILQSGHLQLIVAEIKGALVGSCYLNLIPNLTRGARPYAVIENVIIDTHSRQRGIGQALIDHALRMAWAKDCYKVMLLSGRSDSAVHAFYRKCGFDPDSKQAYIRRAPD